MDDATFGGPADVLPADLCAVADSKAEYGLHFNSSKCKAYVFRGTADKRRLVMQQVHTVSSLIQNVKPDNLCLIGAPLTVDAILVVFTAKRSQSSLMSQRLEILDAHKALFHLIHCFILSKLLYVLRA